MAEDILNTETTPLVAASPGGASVGGAAIPARFDRTDWLSFTATTVLAFAGYLLTLAPDVTLEWSGMLSVGAMYAGVPAQPGYPAWTLYSWFFTKLLPFSNIAWRVAVGSAAASALASGLVALMVSRVGVTMFASMPLFAHLRFVEQNWLRFVCGAVAGLTFAFSGIIWDKAVIADVFPLSTFLFTGVLCLLTAWMLGNRRRMLLALAFLLVGLLLTNSQEMIVVLPGMVCTVLLIEIKLGRDLALLFLPLAAIITAKNSYGAWIVFPNELNRPLLTAFALVGLGGAVCAAKMRAAGTEWKSVLLCGALFFLGLAAYFYLPLSSMTNPPVNWGYARTVEGFVHDINRGQYEHVHPTCDPVRGAAQLWTYLAVAGRQFGWMPLLVSLIPFCCLRQISHVGKRWLLAMFTIWLGVAPLLVVEFNPPHDRAATELMGQYFAPMHVILALWFGLGLILCGAKLSKPREETG